MRSSIGWSKALRWVRNGRAAAPPLVSCRIGVSTSRKPALVQGAPQRPQHRRLGAHHLARARVDDHVDVAQPHARLVRERLVLVGQRPQRLGDHRPARRLHRQLAAPAGDHLAGDPDEVADVDEVLVLRERVLAEVGEREHRLQLGAVALAQPHEAELAGVAQVDHAAHHRDARRRCGCPARGPGRRTSHAPRPACGCGPPRWGRRAPPTPAAAAASRDAPGSARGRRRSPAGAGWSCGQS